MFLTKKGGKLMKRFSTIVLMVGLFLMSAGFAMTPDTTENDSKSYSMPKLSGPYTLTEDEVNFLKIQGIAFSFLYEKRVVSRKKAVKRLVKLLEHRLNIPDKKIKKMIDGFDKNMYFYPGNILPKMNLDFSSRVAEKAVLEYWRRQEIRRLITANDM